MSDAMITVIMSVYDEEESRIRSAIESILEQTLMPGEFLIVCDNPDYRFRHILDEYDRNYDCIRLISNAKNSGLAVSLNTAIMQARGGYVARMDADDESLPDRLALQHSFMQRNPDVGMLGMQAVNVNEQGDEIRVSRKPLTYDVIRRYSRYACPLIHPTWFVRKGVFSQLDGYMNMSPAQDYHFIAKALRAGVIIRNLDEVGLRYTVRGKSVSRKSIYRTIAITQVVRSSVRKGVSLDDELVETMARTEMYRSSYLEFVYDLRCRLTSYHKKGNNRAFRLLATLMIVIVSSMHPLLLKDTVAVYKSTKMV